MATIQFTKEQRLKITMKALMAGIPIKLGSYTYKMFNRGDVIKLPSSGEGVLENDDHWLGIDITGKGEYHGAGDMALIQFIVMAEWTSDEDLIGYMFSLGMKPERGLRT